MTPEQKERKRGYDRKWREENKDRKAEYDNRWRKEHPGYGHQWYLENQEKRADYGRKLREIRKNETLEYQRQYKKGHRDVVSAHNAVTRAVAAGRLARPKECESCGADRFIDGHHPDYSKKLEVVWLCRSCHKNIRAKEL